MLFSDSCIVNELPVLPAARLDGGLIAVDPPSPDADPVRLCHFVFLLTVEGPGGLTLLLLLQLYPDLQLTEEEQKLLSQEGVSLPNNLPLTKVRLRTPFSQELLAA